MAVATGTAVAAGVDENNAGGCRCGAHASAAAAFAADAAAAAPATPALGLVGRCAFPEPTCAPLSAPP
jgi:hypothetical protein